MACSIERQTSQEAVQSPRIQLGEHKPSSLPQLSESAIASNSRQNITLGLDWDRDHVRSISQSRQVSLAAIAKTAWMLFVHRFTASEYVCICSAEGRHGAYTSTFDVLHMEYDMEVAQIAKAVDTKSTNIAKVEHASVRELQHLVSGDGPEIIENIIIFEEDALSHPQDAMCEDDLNVTVLRSWGRWTQS